MPGHHHKGLFIIHDREVMHRPPVLHPVLEHRAIPPIGDQFVWILSNIRIEIVVDHEHHGRTANCPRLIRIDGFGTNSLVWSESVHPNATIAAKFLQEFRSELAMP